ncbi:protein NARROW LEAF 1 [Cannabis sativa]|uniref:protein NARROW LEAF 1 n=1 Tax=Cannabis sativa TaxID=3483 RepID=UPI0029CA02D1|nr:protein NARROW LEAF 1 [Cannabis sativa]XP_030494368.2 protein NARROW LEAF 1 [Cannabis sativa]XP_030494370.2 protein NARROW LEAF 1 [Cannabis sativa]XP_030494372.2 protein NARROW LEAF 1 [Cannabis sativa]XP_060967137.1 protein NARROW LEAF 1 [Cannabis sativa]XP_060967138.1 protein NARROW LEAF 1 [Cannabis sativa]XP_060967139.1 protein NARROW LEAF 1 [Cannabis sativa]XP_060967140.1 protein NARROW LEAF 1 [Cannabis sativa]
MDRSRHNPMVRCSCSTPSEESALDLERNCCSHSNLPSLSPPTTLQPFASAGQHCESSAAYFSWPTSSRLNDAAEERANYFANLQKGVLPENLNRLPKGQQATTLLELMTIRAFHSKILRCYSLGTAIGFRIRRGLLTDIPAILVFVSRKVHKQWLSPIQCLPTALEGPGGVWCDVDVVEFSYFGAPEPAPKEQLYTEIVDDLRGGDPCIGSGSQVASQETYGTLGAIVRSQTGNRQVGFLTNRHVAVDLNYPNQKMFHPLPPTLGPGVYLGAVERATSFITDELWYGIFAGINPETFVRADGAFIPFANDFDMCTVTTSVRGVGEIGVVKIIDLQSPISTLIGKQVMKVGRSSGLTAGTVLAYALEYNDEKGICFLTDFLVVGENQQTFDLEGDSGSLIILKGENGERPRPIGIIWGGTANRGRLKLKIGQPPENWTSGVDLGRLLNLLDLDLITTEEMLKVAVQQQRAASATVIGSTVGDSSTTPDRIHPKEKAEKFEPLGLQIQHIPLDVEPSSPARNSFYVETKFQVEEGPEEAPIPSVEHQFIPSFPRRSPLHHNSLKERVASENLSLLRNGCGEDFCVSLQLGDNEAKRRRSDASTSAEEPK